MSFVLSFFHVYMHALYIYIVIMQTLHVTLHNDPVISWKRMCSSVEPQGSTKASDKLEIHHTLFLRLSFIYLYIYTYTTSVHTHQFPLQNVSFVERNVFARETLSSGFYKLDIYIYK